MANHSAPLSFFAFSKEFIHQNGFKSLYNGLFAGITRQVIYATSRIGLYEILRDNIRKYRDIGTPERLFCGVLAGGCAALISCPAEVSLVRISNDTALPLADRRNYKGVIDAGSQIVRSEGLAALWRGAVPFTQRAMLVGATQVATYDQFRSVFQAHLGMPAASLGNVIAASMSAGLIYSVITNPFETAKNRMAFQKTLADGSLQYTGTLRTIASVARVDGMMALWGGFLPYYIRCGGHTVAMFVVVEQLRKVYVRGFAAPHAR